MPDQTIKCPKCGVKIPLSEALTDQIGDSIRAQYEAEAAKKSQELAKKEQDFAQQQASLKQREKELATKQESIDEQVNEKLKAERLKLAEQKKNIETQQQQIEEQVATKLKAEKQKLSEDAFKKAKEELALHTAQIEQELKEKTSKLADAREKERQLRKQTADLEEKQKNIDLEIARRIDEEKTKIIELATANAVKKAQSEFAAKAKATEEELAEKNAKLAEAQNKELELRKQQRQLEERQANLELELTRKLDEEKKKITEDAIQKATEENMLKMREKDDQLTAMKRQIDELKRKAEVGSQERQGEALEGVLCDALQQAFPSDNFEEVKKGQRGADILQTVRNSTGKECGKILWESKNTKDFSNKWVEKIRADQQEASADVAVIVSVVLPKEVKEFDQIEDVWVSDYACSISLATALRQMLINVTRERLIGSNQNSMRDILYRYVTGQEFALNVKAIINAFKRMHEDLEQEKRAMQKIWKSREKQISTVLENVSGICGSIDGLVGRQVLPPIEPLMLESTTDEENIENKGTENIAQDDIPF